MALQEVEDSAIMCSKVKI